MIESGYELIAVFTAWLIGLCFVRVKTGRAALFSLIVGVLCGGCSYALQLIDANAWIELGEIGIFVLAALTARFILKIRWDEALLSGLLALGAFAILRIPWHMFWVSSTDIAKYAPWLGLGCVVLFIGMLIILYKRFPEKDWQSAFKKKEEQGLKLRRIYMYICISCPLHLSVCSCVLRY